MGRRLRRRLEALGRSLRDPAGPVVSLPAGRLVSSEKATLDGACRPSSCAGALPMLRHWEQTEGTRRRNPPSLCHCEHPHAPVWGTRTRTNKDPRTFLRSHTIPVFYANFSRVTQFLLVERNCPKGRDAAISGGWVGVAQRPPARRRICNGTPSKWDRLWISWYSSEPRRGDGATGRGFCHLDDAAQKS